MVRRMTPLLILCLSLAGCRNTPTQASAATPNPPNAPAVVATETKNDVVASGPITVENQLDLVAQREGIIAEVGVDTGSAVRKGQILARLDDRQLTADSDAARQQAASIEADLKNWEATVKMAEVDLDRSEKMLKANLITASQVEHDRFKTIATRYEYDREQKNYERALSVAKSLSLELEKTRIVAPFDGVIARRYVRRGQHVAMGDRFFWLTATSPLRVKFTLPEAYAGTLKRGSAVRLCPAERPDEQHSAKIVLISPVIDPASNTIDVTAQVTGDPGSLRPGMIANIQLDPTR
jgi:membrane fusion protein, multidrug efflux system